MSWSHHREPASGRVSSFLSGASTKTIAAIFAAGLCVGIGATWLLSAPSSAPQVTAQPSPPAPAQPATEAADNSSDPCERQTWPYVDDKCRAQLAQKSQGAREVRVIPTDKGAPSTLVTTPAPPPENRPAASAPPAHETVARAPAAETAREQAVAPAPSQQAPASSAEPKLPAITAQATASIGSHAPEVSANATIPPMSTQQASAPAASTQTPAPTARTQASAPAARVQASAPAASTQAPVPTPTTQHASAPAASTPEAAPSDSTQSPSIQGARAPARNEIRTTENEQPASKRSKRADRRKRSESRTARIRPQDGDVDGPQIRTYEMEGGRRVTVHQRGRTMQVGDRVDFGDSPRSRRRVTTLPERGSRRDEDLSSLPVVSRGSSGEYFFDR